jgi:FtsP/CotA-like multicopper oxidase with cupredoxin domain
LTLNGRAFLSGMVGARLACAQGRQSGGSAIRPADVTLTIGRTQIEVAPGHTITTTTYNGRAPGPLIRMREGIPSSVNILNRTDVTEYVHWHGFEVPPELDGTEEESSLAVPAGGHLQYEIMPLQAGSRYVHSHAMTMSDLCRGVYSGQFAFVYVEPKRNPGRYDQEIFLSTHDWEPRLMMEADDQGAEEDEDEREQSSMEIEYAVRSINGKALGHGDPIRVKQGQRVLFHVLNASATENVQLRRLRLIRYTCTAIPSNLSGSAQRQPQD